MKKFIAILSIFLGVAIFGYAIGDARDENPNAVTTSDAQAIPAQDDKTPVAEPKDPQSVSDNNEKDDGKDNDDGDDDDDDDDDDDEDENEEANDLGNPKNDPDPEAAS